MYVHFFFTIRILTHNEYIAHDHDGVGEYVEDSQADGVEAVPQGRGGTQVEVDEAPRVGVLEVELAHVQQRQEGEHDGEYPDAGDEVPVWCRVGCGKK